MSNTRILKAYYRVRLIVLNAELWFLRGLRKVIRKLINLTERYC